MTSLLKSNNNIPVSDVRYGYIYPQKQNHNHDYRIRGECLAKYK